LHLLTKAEETARAGYDMIGFDRSTLAAEENVRQTKEDVEAIKSINADVLVVPVRMSAKTWMPWRRLNPNR